MSKNLFSKTYEVNGRTYTDNLPTNARIMFTKEQYIEYEQQKEEIERLNRENTILKQTMSNNSLLINENVFLKERIDKAIEYIYHWSTQRKIFFDKIDRHLNGKPRFYGDIADLLNILEGEDND